MKAKYFLGFVVIFLVFLVGCDNQATGKVVANEEITIGYAALRISLPLFVAIENDYFADEGLDVNLVRYDTAQPMMQVIGAGKLHIGGYSALPVSYNAMLKSGRKVYMITALIEDQDHLISYFLVPEDTPNNITVSDLKGKKIGIVPAIAYKKWIEVILNENGLSVDDVILIPITPNLQATALESGLIDALFTNDPAGTTAIQKAIAKKISDEVLVPKYLGEPFIFGTFHIEKEYADNNPKITQKISRILDKAVMFVNTNQEEAKNIMKNYVHESQKDFVDYFPDSLYLTTKEVNPEDFQKVSDQYHDLGIIPDELDVAGLVIS